jgi:hypothetical protein
MDQHVALEVVGLHEVLLAKETVVILLQGVS